MTGANLNVTLGSGFTPTISSSFTIIDNAGTAGVTGTFNGHAGRVDLNVGGNTFQITYAGGAGGNSVVLTAVYPSTTAVTYFPHVPVSGSPSRSRRPSPGRPAIGNADRHGRVL